MFLILEGRFRLDEVKLPSWHLLGFKGQASTLRVSVWECRIQLWKPSRACCSAPNCLLADGDGLDLKESSGANMCRLRIYCLKSATSSLMPGGALSVENGREHARYSIYVFLAHGKDGRSAWSNRYPTERRMIHFLMAEEPHAFQQLRVCGFHGLCGSRQAITVQWHDWTCSRLVAAASYGAGGQGGLGFLRSYLPVSFLGWVLPPPCNRLC